MSAINLAGAPGKSHYFIADLHLDRNRQDEYALALNFLGSLNDAASLYILGDLFEYWVGDDAGIPVYNDVISALAVLSAGGCAVSLMLGNRDFLLGEDFAKACGAQLVREDELIIELHGKPVLLMHGDTLCIDDKPYQQFRAQVRNPQWQAEFLAKSIDERLAFAAGLREQSRTLSAGKTPELMDVNSTEVSKRLRACHCQTMIHGHTHRPADHYDDSSGDRRLVVGDWHPRHAKYVVSDGTRISLQTFTT